MEIAFKKHSNVAPPADADEAAKQQISALQEVNSQLEARLEQLQELYSERTSITDTVRGDEQLKKEFEVIIKRIRHEYENYIQRLQEQHNLREKALQS